MLLKNNRHFSTENIVISGLTFLVFCRTLLILLEQLMQTKYYGIMCDPYIASNYLFSLSQGFMPRSVMGTIWEFSAKIMSWRTFMILQMIFFLCGITFFANWCYRHAVKSESPIWSTLMVFLYFSLPTTYLGVNMPGLLDTYFLTTAIIALLLVHRRKIPTAISLIFAGIMIHDVFIFLCLPPIIAYALYKTDFSAPSSRRQLFTLLAGTVIILGIFAFARYNQCENQFRQSIGTIAYDKIFTVHQIPAAAFTRREILDHGIVNASTLSIAEHWNYYKKSMFGSSMQIIPMAVTWITLFPALFAIFFTWKKFFQTTPSNNKEQLIKNITLCISFLPLLLICMLTTDIARWCGISIAMQLVIWLLLSDNIRIRYPRQAMFALFLLAILYSFLKPAIHQHISVTTWELGNYTRKVIKERAIPTKLENDFSRYDQYYDKH